MINWSYIESEKSKTLFIIDDKGKTVTVSDTHPNFENIKNVLDRANGKPVEGRSEHYVMRFLDPSNYYLGERLEVDPQSDKIKLDGEEISVGRLNILLSLDTMIDEHPDTRNRKNIK